ncbi:MAG: DMT family transporter [Clostridia bacterium]|nr:DMT family transporter [Clostridia bacterium]
MREKLVEKIHNTLENSSLVVKLVLAFTTFLWSLTYIWNNDIAYMSISVPNYLFLRYSICTVLLLLMYGKELKHVTSKNVLHTVIIGLCLLVVAVVQVIAALYTTPGNLAFIISAYVILVPVASLIFLKHKASKKVWIAMLICVIGLYVINVKPGESMDFNFGNFLAIFGAIALAIEIVLVNVASEEGASVGTINIIPNVVCALGGLIWSCIDGGFDFSAVDFWSLNPIYLIAIIGSFLPGISQAYCQQHINPNTASIIYSLESVMTCFISIFMGYDTISFGLIAGGSLITGAILFMEIDFSFLKKKH